MNYEIPKALKELEKLSKMDILVGWVDGSKMHPAEPGSKSPPASLATIARTLHYGRMAGTTLSGRKYPAIPARPFFDVMKSEFGDTIRKTVKVATMRILSGQMDAEGAARLIGTKAKGLLIEAIGLRDKYVALSPVTIANREHGGDQPLVDTGTLRNSVDFQIKR